MEFFLATNTTLAQLYIKETVKFIKKNQYDINGSTRETAIRSIKNIIHDSVLENGLCLLQDYESSGNYSNFKLNEIITVQCEYFRFTLEFRLAHGYPCPDDAIMALFIDTVTQIKNHPIPLDVLEDVFQVKER